MTKETISSSYIDTMKKIHGDKEYKYIRKFVVTGARDGNIGGAIWAELTSKIGRGEMVDIDQFDLTKDSQIEEFVGLYLDCDTLVLCHGMTHLDWIENLTNRKINDLVNINLTSHIKIISRYVECSISSEYRKCIVIIGSMAASSVLNASSAYCAAKAGLQHFVKCIAWELAPKGYDVYLINPSNVADTPMTEETIHGLARYRGITYDEAVKYWASGNPRKTVLSKFEIGRLVAELARGNHQYLSGTPLNLTGGQR